VDVREVPKTGKTVGSAGEQARGDTAEGCGDVVAEGVGGGGRVDTASEQLRAVFEPGVSGDVARCAPVGDGRLNGGLGGGVDGGDRGGGRDPGCLVGAGGGWLGWDGGWVGGRVQGGPRGGRRDFWEVGGRGVGGGQVGARGWRGIGAA